ncbi:MAG: lytic transglycosylase protein [Hyphomicrobiales bacterium]|nr:lytic transglycosylase protein [Hyphomicrobiales bacterium]
MGIQPIAVSPSLAAVLNAAGDRNNVDFNYLLQTAVRESSLNPQAKAQSSSATGLFQFLDATWLQVMKQEGPRLGYQHYADAIQPGSNGELQIADPKIRAEVLKLRENPGIAADMAAAFTKNNGDYLRQKFGRTPSPGELYIAHFLGAKGAEKMFNAGLQNPDQVAADLFPQQAANNHNIFYANGHARTIREVYHALVAKHVVPSTGANFAAQQMAAATQSVPGNPSANAPVIPSRFGPQDMSFKALFSTDVQGATASPLQAPEAGQGAAFFTQLYGQQ